MRRPHDRHEQQVMSGNFAPFRTKARPKSKALPPAILGIKTIEIHIADQGAASAALFALLVCRSSIQFHHKWRLITLADRHL
jgi:hypothetical protein